MGAAHLSKHFLRSKEGVHLFGNAVQEALSLFMLLFLHFELFPSLDHLLNRDLFASKDMGMAPDHLLLNGLQDGLDPKTPLLFGYLGKKEDSIEQIPQFAKCPKVIFLIHCID